MYAIVWKAAAAVTVYAGAVIGLATDEDTPLGTGGDILDGLIGAIGGVTVVALAVLTVRWVNAVADRREQAADATVDDYRDLYQAALKTLSVEREESARLRLALAYCRENH